MMKRMMTMTGFASLVAVALIALPATAHPWGGYQMDECGGEAPLVTLCTTGLHFRFADEPLLRHGFTDVAEGYTGTLESALTYLGGERIFRCDYDAGSLVAESCAGSGDFPPPQSYFTQVCRSYALGSTTTGGAGGWGCFMEHG